MGHRVSELMISVFAGGERDKFGRQKNARLPLLLPKVMEGRPIASDSPLLSLPPEILGDIIDLIADEKTTLAALALVNSDCRQLARSCQFADICFDYGRNSSQLLLRLSDEARTRLGCAVGGNTTRPLFIGPCIRRVTVSPHPEWVAHVHNDLYESIWGDAADVFPREKRDQLSKKAFDWYMATFRTPLLITLKQAMPNIEALSWCDGMCLDDTFFKIVTHLPIQSLKMSRVHIGEPYRLEPPMTPPAMPLESLSFGAHLCDEKVHKEERTGDADTQGNRNPIFRQALSTCQPFRDLETLVVPYLGDQSAATALVVVDFISRHPHARKLSVSRGAPQFMDSRLLPLLSGGRWSNLASLSLAWDEPGIEETTRRNIATISTESLAAIGSIVSLEQLHLSAGEPAGWRHQWLVDHIVVRSNLRGLARLKRLAFSRDTYMVPGGLSALDEEGYYERRLVTPADRNEALEWAALGGAGSIRHMDEREGNNDNGPGLTDHEIWERAHRNRMIQEAERYAAVFQQLEWVYCGQWPMDIRKEQTLSGINRFAVPLGKSRDSCRTLLGRMFAMGEDDD
ncbi:hypothetical protein DL762_001938 [Monosporascus cannonballus]|uniref:F-box domain-containing protein n=1 Tax=Monosporascus cannonballus TaxID=155416 RepID=A0ABY0HFC7_9PEZI|nr:hypothetical protein DL762_001938 [Monosporascus cannonballus]